MFRTLFAGAVTATVALTAADAHAAILDSESFEGPLTSRIRESTSWTHTDNRGYVRGPQTHGWDGQTGEGAGIFFAYNQRLRSPVIDTSAHDMVHINLDFRPAGPTTSASTWAGIFRVFVKNPTTGASAEALNIVLDRASGTIKRTHGTNGANADTSMTWSYDEDAVNSLEIILDQVNRRWGLIFDNGTTTYEEYDLRWLDLSAGGPLGTFDHFEIQGANGGAPEEANPKLWLAFDNYAVTDGSPIPEPASLALLGAGLLVLARRRD